jgi:hypothetical protein
MLLDNAANSSNGELQCAAGAGLLEEARAPSGIDAPCRQYRPMDGLPKTKGEYYTKAPQLRQQPHTIPALASRELFGRGATAVFLSCVLVDISIKLSS